MGMGGGEGRCGMTEKLVIRSLGEHGGKRSQERDGTDTQTDYEKYMCLSHMSFCTDACIYCAVLDVT